MRRSVYVATWKMLPRDSAPNAEVEESSTVDESEDGKEEIKEVKIQKKKAKTAKATCRVKPRPHTVDMKQWCKSASEAKQCFHDVRHIFTFCSSLGLQCCDV